MATLQTVVDDDWRNLLQSSTNLNLTHPSSRINRSLKGIEKEAQRLSSKTSRHVPTNQLRDFAAQIGVDIRNQTQYISSIDSFPSQQRQQRQQQQQQHQHQQQQQRLQQSQLQQIEEQKTSIPLISGSMHPTSTMDLNNFLKYHHEKVISSTIQQCQHLCSQHFKTKYVESMEQEWNSTKMDILNYFGCNQQQQTHSQQPQQQHHNDLSLLNHSTLRYHQQQQQQQQIDSEDVEMNDEYKHNHSSKLALEFEESFGKIICDLSLYRNVKTPLFDYDRNVNNDQYIQRTNIFAPISEFGIIHHRIYEKYKYHDHMNENIKNNLKFLEYLMDLWQCVSSMVFETGINNETQCYLKENEYKSFYLNQDIGLQRLFVNGSKQYLEKMYFESIQKAIEKNKSFAKKGGKPGKRYIIKAFVRLKYQIQNGMNVIPSDFDTIHINNEIFPLWPLVYYSYRIGDIDSCLHFLSFKTNRHHHNHHHHNLNSAEIVFAALNNLREETFTFNQKIQTKCHDMQEIIHLFKTEPITLNETIWKEKLDLFYKEKIIKECGDPFELIMYKLIGKFFGGATHLNLEQVLNVQEDWLWFHLSTLYFTNYEIPQWIDKTDKNMYDPYITLIHLQNEIKQLGPTRFDNRILFVISLLLTQQFEDAISYLSIYDPLQSIHLGICLNFYGLLNNKHHLIQTTLKYINKFKLSPLTTKQQLIFYYLYVINDPDDDKVIENNLINYLCEPNTILRQLVIGKINEDSISISNGLLLKYCSIHTFIKICQLSANKAYENGEIEHCILLYILCGHFNLASTICIKLVSSQIMDKFENSSKQFIVNLAKQLFKINQIYLENQNFHSLSKIDNQHIQIINDSNKLNLISVIHFAEFYDLFYQIKETLDDELIEKALNIINTNNMIPTNDENVIKFKRNVLTMNQIINLYKHKLFKLENDLKKYLGDICVSIMQILLIQFTKFRRNKQYRDLQMISTKCQIIYNFFNYLESEIKPIGAGDAAKEISNLYFQTRID